MIDLFNEVDREFKSITSLETVSNLSKEEQLTRANSYIEQWKQAIWDSEYEILVLEQIERIQAVKTYAKEKAEKAKDRTVSKQELDSIENRISNYRRAIAIYTIRIQLMQKMIAILQS